MRERIDGSGSTQPPLRSEGPANPRPEVPLDAEVGECVQLVDPTGVHRPGGGHHGHAPAAIPPVLTARVAERRKLEPVLGIDRDRPPILGPHSEERRYLVDRAVDLGRG